MGWTTGTLWFDSQQQQDEFPKAPRMATQTKQPPISALYFMIFIILSRKNLGLYLHLGHYFYFFFILSYQSAAIQPVHCYINQQTTTTNICA